MTNLSPRQSQVLALIGDGLTYGEIGDRLGISESAAKHHTDLSFIVPKSLFVDPNDLSPLRIARCQIVHDGLRALRGSNIRPLMALDIGVE